jgi:threonine aldolase
VRRMFGGGMRQVGVLAAAGLVALRQGPARLAEDHENARRLAAALAELPAVQLDPAAVRTNIVVFGVPDAAAFLARLRDHGVLGVPFGPRTVRLVTHRDAPRERVDAAIARIRAAVA